MRPFLLRTAVALLAIASPTVLPRAPAAAATETPGTASQQATVAALLARYPDGGQALADALARIVEADPTIVAVAVAAALDANPAQQQAIGAGLAEAALFFANSNSPAAQAAQQQIQAAIASAPAGAATAFTADGGTIALFTLLGSAGSGLTTSTCVSPNRPGAGC